MTITKTVFFSFKIFYLSATLFSEGLFAQTGTLQGTVELRNAPQLIRRERGTRYRIGVTSMEMHSSVSPKSEYKNVVISLEGKPLDSLIPQNLPNATMDQKNAEFIPHVLAVRKGTAVEFINQDVTYHNVFSLSTTRKFNIGRRPTGETVPVKFDKPGVVQVFCDIHSNMTAYIVVLENSFFAHPDEKGHFILHNIPPGAYTLKTWHERLKAIDYSVMIESGKASTISVILE